MGWKMEEEDGPSRFGILSSYPGYDTHWAWIWSNYQNGVLQNTWYNAQGDSSAFLLSSNIWWAAPSGSATGDPDYFMGYYGWTGGRVSPPITGYTPLVYPHPLVKQGSGGQTNPIISISPVSGDHGTVAVGSTNDLTFRVRNIGGGTLAGTATVPAGPFSIWGGGSYSLGSHESQVITLRFTPVQAANTNQTVTFTGGGGASATVRGRTPP
jgi:hypothetical protein